MLKKLPIIGVMGSSDKSWEELALPLGELIALHDYHLLTGAGAGVMTSVAQGFTSVEEREGLSFGIVPTVNYQGQLLPRETYPNPYIEVPILTPLDVKAQNDSTPYSRNFVNVMTSNALVVLPGDHGTRNEVSIAIQIKKPMILFGPKEAFTQFPQYPAHVETIDEVREFLESGSAKFRADEKREE
jgi:uncharacterized protein (TIGR00725 family)